MSQPPSLKPSTPSILTTTSTSSKTSTASNKQEINLLRGWPSLSLHPTTQLKNAAKKVLEDEGVSGVALSYGPDPGYQKLREEVARWLGAFYGGLELGEGRRGVGRICVSGGASQNLACILQVFTDPLYTRNVWMVAPCYYLACRIFEDAGFGGRLRAVPEGNDGIDLEHLERELNRGGKDNFDSTREPTLKPRRSYSKIYRHVIYCVPTFSNPSGRSMTVETRRKLVDLARRYNALVITDDVYDFLQWQVVNTPTFNSKRSSFPRLVDIDAQMGPHRGDPDGFGNTVSNGSFSKILGPGCRTGWAEASEKFIFGLQNCGSTRSGGSPSQLTATFIAHMLEKGQVQKHIFEVLLPSYASRYRKLIGAIERILHPLGCTSRRQTIDGVNTAGGYFIWFSLPSPLEAEQVAAVAQERENLIVAHGNMFEVWGDEKSASFSREIRVCFAWEDEHKLTTGIARLGKVIEFMLQSGGIQGSGGSRDLGSFY